MPCTNLALAGFDSPGREPWVRRFPPRNEALKGRGNTILGFAPSGLYFFIAYPTQGLHPGL